MIHTMTGYVLEADEPETAVNELLMQIDLASLRTHSIGLLSCYLDFADSGIAAAISRAMPFPVIGCTTPGSVVPGYADMLMLSLIVLTSDDVAFQAALSAPLCIRPEESLTALYRDAAAKSTFDPVMLLAYQPMMPSLSGDFVADCLGAASGNLPVFGTISLDVQVDVNRPLVFFNGESYTDRLALLVISGNTRPRFFVRSFPVERTLRQRATITQTAGNRMITINDMPAATYMEKAGLIQDGRFSGGYMAIPVAIDYHDGTPPKACSFFGTDPDGAIICGSEVPAGVTLAFGSLNHADVMQTTSALLEDAMRGGGNVMILFSCFSRNMVLNSPMAEMELVLQKTAASMPFIFVYSGGELCPLYNQSGHPANRYHNYSIIACVLGEAAAYGE